MSDTLTTKIVVKAVDKASATLKSLGNNAKKTVTGAKTGFNSLNNTLQKNQATFAGMAAGGAIAFGALTLGIKDVVKAFGVQEQAEQQLNAVIKSTGGAAGLTAEEMKNMAAGLQEVTTFGDETILTGSNILMTFTSIGEEVFPQATETMLDMSQALGQDLKSSAIQLGKALNDPILGMTALRRVGVNFNEDAVKMVKTMVESGDVMGAQKFILQELSTEFGGSARAAAQTFTGQMQQLKNQVGDLKENIGRALVPVLEKLGAMAKSATSYLQRLSSEHPGLIRAVTFLAMGASGLIAAFGTLGLVIPKIAAGFALIGRAAKTAYGQIFIIATATYAAIKGLTALMNMFAPASKGVSESWGEAGDSAQEAGSDFIEMGDAAEEAAGAAGGAGGAASDAASKMAEAVAEENEKFKESMAEMVQSHLDTIKRLEKDILSEKENFAETQKDKQKDYKRTMADMTKEHSRKVDDIKSQIDEEKAKGSEADNSRLAELQKRLDRENEDYAEQKKRREEDYKEEMARDDREHQEKISALETELQKENELRIKYADDFAKFKDVQLADEFAKLKQSHADQLQAIQEQASAASAAGGAGAAGISDAYSGAFEDITKGFDGLENDLKIEMPSLVEILTKPIYEFGDAIRRTLDKIFGGVIEDISGFIVWAGGHLGGFFTWLYDKWVWIKGIATGAWETIKTKTGEIWEQIKETVKGAFDRAMDAVRAKMKNILNPIIEVFNQVPFLPDIPKLALGGIAQRQENQVGRGADTTPYMLSPGEMVLSKSQQSRLFNMISGQSGGGSGGTIEVNFNNVNIRNENDLNTIVTAVKNTLARDAELVSRGI